MDDDIKKERALAFAIQFYANDAKTDDMVIATAKKFYDSLLKNESN